MVTTGPQQFRHRTVFAAALLLAVALLAWGCAPAPRVQAPPPGPGGRR